jgi:uncharacterized protein
VSRAFLPSRYLRFIPRSDGLAVYHSLFGNLALIDDAGREVLDAFSRSATIDEAAGMLSSRPYDAVRAYANDLILRGFLLPSGCDEYVFVDDDQQKRIANLKSGYLVRALQLILDKRCNYRCSYCFMDFQPGSRGTSNGETRMSIETAELSMRKLIELLRRNGNDCLNVELFGGEPLMNWPVIRHILTTFGNEHDGVTILYSITTNGALLTAEMAELFLRHGVTVTVSVDIPCKIEGIPRMTAKSGDRIQRQLGILREHGNALTFNSVISAATIEHVDPRSLIDLAREYGVAMVGLILDLDLAFYRVPENRERAASILRDAYRYGRETGVPVGGYWYLIFSQIAGRQAIHLESGYKTCPATGCKVSIEPDGSMFTCECTNGEIGSIADLDAVLASEAYASYALRAYRHAPECKGCDLEGFCSGVCVGSLENEYGRADLVEAGACEIFRTITRDLIVDLPRGEIDDLRLLRPRP